MPENNNYNNGTFWTGGAQGLQQNANNLTQSGVSQGMASQSPFVMPGATNNNIIQPNAQDRAVGAYEQQRGNLLDENQRQREAMDKAINKAIDIHKEDFLSGKCQVVDCKMLQLAGKDKADTVRLDISIKDGPDKDGEEFQMYFDDDGNLQLENHRESNIPQIVGDKAIDSLDTPEKRDNYLATVDKGQVVSELGEKDIDMEVDKAIKDLGFKSKDELERVTGVDSVKEAQKFDKPEMAQNIEKQASEKIGQDATMIDANTRFGNTNVRDSLQLRDDAKEVGINSKGDAVILDNKGNYKYDQNLKSIGTVNNARIMEPNQTGYNGPLGPTIANAHTGEGLAMGPYGEIGEVRDINSNVATYAPVNEKSVDAPRVNDVMARNNDYGETHQNVQAENMQTMDDSGDLSELQLITNAANEKGLGTNFDQVHAYYHAHGNDIDATREYFEREADNYHSPEPGDHERTMGRNHPQ